MGEALSRLDAGAGWRWLFAARADLADRRAEIDALNVYPVPDGDTGTNLYLTLHTAMERLAGVGISPKLSVASHSLALEALLAARGNSGVIFSQFLRGFAEVTGEDPDADTHGLGPQAVAAALERACQRAWESVTHPVEGTILTVAQDASRAATSVASRGRALVEVTSAALARARHSLEHTPDKLATLARAGVVDAGGAGLVVLLGALHSTVASERAEVGSFGGGAGAQGLPGEGTAAYEVMYVVRGLDEGARDRLGAALLDLGDSLVIAGDSAAATVHVHTADAGAAIEAALAMGRPEQVRVTWLGAEASPDQHGHDLATTPAPLPDALATPTTRCAVIACAPGPRLAALMAEGGARVVASAPGRRATTGELLAARRALHADGVVILANHDDTLMAAEAAARLAEAEGRRTLVVPTRTSMAGLAALALYDPDEDPEEAAGRMHRAALACRTGMVVTARSPVHTAAGDCREGDAVAYVGRDAVRIGRDLDELADDLLDRLIGEGAELVTLVSGAIEPVSDHPPIGDRVAERLARRHPGLEVVVFGGDPQVYDLLIGVE